MCSSCDNMVGIISQLNCLSIAGFHTWIRRQQTQIFSNIMVASVSFVSRGTFNHVFPTLTMQGKLVDKEILCLLLNRRLDLLICLACLTREN